MIQDGFHAALRRKIDEEILARSNQLISGFALDYADYRNRAGYIQALVDVLASCNQIEQKLYSNPLKGAA